MVSSRGVLSPSEREELARKFAGYAITFGVRCKKSRPGLMPDRDENISRAMVALNHCLAVYDGPRDDEGAFKGYLRSELRFRLKNDDPDVRRAEYHGSPLAFRPYSDMADDWDDDGDGVAEAWTAPREERPGPDREAEGREVGDAIRGCLELLSPKRREAVEAWMAGESMKSLAARTGRYPNAPWGCLKAGLDDLRALMRERHPSIVSEVEGAR